MTATPRQLLLIDDDVELTTLLVDYLTLEGFHARAANSGIDGLRIMESENFDLVILDVMMPGMNGVEVLKKIRETSKVPVIMLTAKGDPIDRILGLELGADDYVLKPCPPRELVARISAVLRRSDNSMSSTPSSILGPVSLDKWQHKVVARTSVGEVEISLTATEFTIFSMLIKNAPAPVKKQDLYFQVWSRPQPQSDRSIDVHVSSIRHKIADVLGKKILLESIRGFGYRLRLNNTEEAEE